ncbi:MAG: twin transmembrane helix small protein [Paracoccaceae bacterium]
MTDDPLLLLVIGGCLGVLAILIWGVSTFGRGGAEDGKRSNRIMQYRIIGQFVVVIVIVGFVWLRQRG